MTASRSRVLYIGVTSDIELRVAQHKNKTHKGFSCTHHCDRLVWFERHAYVGNAIGREKQLKGLLREKKVALVREANPTWEDLSLRWGKPVERYGEK